MDCELLKIQDINWYHLEIEREPRGFYNITSVVNTSYIAVVGDKEMFKKDSKYINSVLKFLKLNNINIVFDMIGDIKISNYILSYFYDFKQTIHSKLSNIGYSSIESIDVFHLMTTIFCILGNVDNYYLVGIEDKNYICDQAYDVYELIINNYNEVITTYETRKSKKEGIDSIGI